MISRSPDRHTFQSQRHRDILAADPTNEEAKKMVEMYGDWTKRDLIRDADPEWAVDNLEHDLRSTEWVLEKARVNKIYAQHLYAALCNNDFTKNEAWPLLQEKRWSCSWRSAGGIIANMLQAGDYIDWYCTGIRDSVYKDDPHVPEGVITDEIREDLFELGWVPAEQSDAD